MGVPARAAAAASAPRKQHLHRGLPLGHASGCQTQRSAAAHAERRPTPRARTRTARHAAAAAARGVGAPRAARGARARLRVRGCCAPGFIRPVWLMVRGRSFSICVSVSSLAGSASSSCQRRSVSAHSREGSASAAVSRPLATAPRLVTARDGKLTHAQAARPARAARLLLGRHGFLPRRGQCGAGLGRRRPPAPPRPRTRAGARVRAAHSGDAGRTEGCGSEIFLVSHAPGPEHSPSAGELAPSAPLLAGCALVPHARRSTARWLARDSARGSLSPLSTMYNTSERRVRSLTRGCPAPSPGAAACSWARSRSNLSPRSGAAPRQPPRPRSGATCCWGTG
jgi:hypothetical protein